MKLAILTPTYNHPEHLKELYVSLVNQEDENFVWIIINDGSSQETDDAVRTFLSEKRVQIDYEYQDNAGKSAAVNRGLDKARDFDFVLICDDDEQLKPKAVTIVKDYYERYLDQCACICFNRADKTGKPLSNFTVDKDVTMSFQECVSKKYHADGYLGYFVKKIENIRFPLFKGEKYIGPTVLLMLATKHSGMLWASAVIGETEYLEGGITKQGRKLRIKNPKGMIYRAALMVLSDSSFLFKYGYSVHAYAYKSLAGLSRDELKAENIDMGVFYPTYLEGFILAQRWKYLLNKNERTR